MEIKKENLSEKDRPECIAIMNQKGGCGKTTTSINLARALSYKGKKTLLIDFDPQGHSSLGLGIKADPNRNIYHAVTGQVEPEQIILKEAYPGLDLFPASIILSSLEQTLSTEKDREYRLAKTLEKVKNHYDFIIIDCPPALGNLSINAIMSAQKVIVPIEPSRFALDGALQFQETVQFVCRSAQKNIKVRHLISMFDLESPFAEDYVAQIEEKLSFGLFKTRVRKSTHIQYATHAGKPVLDYDTESLGFIDFMSLAHELIWWTHEDWLKEFFNKTQNGPQKTPEGICFLHQAKQAQAVEVVGSFAAWQSELTRMQKIPGSDCWYTVLPLDPGIYEYQYKVDGHYEIDEFNPDIQLTGLGVKKSVLKV